MSEELKKVIEDLDNAVNLLSGVYNGLDNIEHPMSELAYQLYVDSEELHETLKEDV